MDAVEKVLEAVTPQFDPLRKGMQAVNKALGGQPAAPKAAPEPKEAKPIQQTPSFISLPGQPIKTVPGATMTIPTGTLERRNF
jgi:hypothetical protein